MYISARFNKKIYLEKLAEKGDIVQES